MDAPNTPPSNGTRYRLESLESSVSSLNQTVGALNTFLTGEGVKGSSGKLGEIADSLERIGTQLSTAQASREAEITKIVDARMANARLRAYSLTGKAFWALLVALISVAGIIVTIVLHGH